MDAHDILLRRIEASERKYGPDDFDAVPAWFAHPAGTAGPETYEDFAPFADDPWTTERREGVL